MTGNPWCSTTAVGCAETRGVGGRRLGLAAWPWTGDQVLRATTIAWTVRYLRTSGWKFRMPPRECYAGPEIRATGFTVAVSMTVWMSTYI